MIIRKVLVNDNKPTYQATFTAPDGELITAHNIKAFDAAVSAYNIYLELKDWRLNK